MSKALSKKQELILPGSYKTGKMLFECIETDFTILQQSKDVTSLFTMDALVKGGGWNRFVGIQIDEERREKLIERIVDLSQTPAIRGSRQSTKVLIIGTSPGISSDSVETPTVTDIEWVRDHVQLLKRLNSDQVNECERRTAVLFAETLEITESNRDQLLIGLHSFISKNRFSNDEDTITSLGSAIRKYAMNMAENDFEGFAEWLRPTQTATLNHHVELELTKGIVWRLSYVTVQPGHKYSLLSSTLTSIAMDYLTPRLILQENYASITLNAIVGVVLLAVLTGDNADVIHLCEKVKAICIGWFYESLGRRVDDASRSIQLHNVEIATRVRELFTRVR